MSNQQNDDYNEYMYEMEKQHDERENQLAGELAQHEKDEADGKEPDDGFDNEETEMIPGNPMIDYNPQDELDRIGNRESYQTFRGF